MLIRALVPLLSVAIATVTAAAPLAASEGESELTFVDLRLHGGLNATNGHGAALTLMCGDIGNKDQHVVDTWRDIGVVIGLRGDAEHVKAKLNAGPTLQENILALSFMGGVGAYIDAEDLFEVVAGYGIGQHSDGTRSGFHKWGTAKKLSLEMGYYHTFAKHYQIGALVGAEYDTFKYDAAPGVKGKALGLNAAVEIGYRF